MGQEKDIEKEVKKKETVKKETKKKEEKNVIEPVTTFTVQGKKSNKGGFASRVITPFIFGMLGSAALIGVCFGVPEVRAKVLPLLNISAAESTTKSTTNNVNTDVISLKEFSETGVSVASKVLPSVVGITVEFPVNSIFSFGTTTASASGSGIIISEDGYILTNNHIVSSSQSSYYYEVGEASKVQVYLYNDKTPIDATIIGTDAQTDIAVIKIDKTGLSAAEIGDSDKVTVGEYCMAIGNPLGMQSSVSSGIISAVNRDISTDGKTFKLIQTDAAINAGNSGGALVNSQGQVIGINTLKISSTGVEGMGFSIPINTAKPIYEQLIEYKKVKRPYIGISGRDIDEKTAKANNLVVGIYVLSVEEFSAAEKAGIKPGDVVTSIDGTPVSKMDELNQIKDTHQIGDTVKIKIYRDGSEKELDVKLQEQ